MGYPLPPSDDQVDVTTPEPTYFWDVGEVGFWDGNPGALNTVSPTPQYNAFGYDAVGYSQYEVAYYRDDVPGMPIPCGFEVYQGMAMYCVYTFRWVPYVFNDLTAQIKTASVVDCKNNVCATINQ